MLIYDGAQPVISWTDQQYLEVKLGGEGGRGDEGGKLVSGDHTF